MSPAQRLEELALRGVQVYLDERGQLRATCEGEFAHVLAAAKPMLRRHKSEIVAELKRRKGLFPCASCGRVYFHAANVTCFWCRQAAAEPPAVAS